MRLIFFEVLIKMIKNNTMAAASGHIDFQGTKKRMHLLQSKNLYAGRKLGPRRPIKYARGFNEPLHLTINLTNKRNILKLNFQYKDGGLPDGAITYSTSP